MSSFEEVPANRDWPKFRARFLFRQRRERAHPDDVQLTASQAYGVIAQSTYNELSDTRATAALAGTENFLHVDKDDFVISLRTFEGGIERARERGCISPAYTVMRSSEKVEPTFFHYLLKSSAFIQTLQTAVTGIRDGKSVRYEQFADLVLPTPDHSTQKAIADFLDRETARIDQLVEKKQRLVALLVEREKNLIGECLARGINPEAELKAVHQEWLGSIPSHWEVFPLKSLIWYQEGPGIMADDFRDEGVPLLRIKGLSGQFATLKGCNYLDPEKVKKRWNHFRVEIGDFLISASATRGGIASLVTEDVMGAVPYTGIIRIKPRNKGYVSEIIPYFLLSSLFDTQIDLLSAGSTIQHFGPTHLGRMKAPLPPQAEQREIAEFLDKRVPLIREARAQTEDSQAKLKEFRSALITAAVTGQINVATWGKQGQTDRRLDEIEEAMQA